MRSTTAAPDVAWADTNLFVALFAASSHPLHDDALQVFRRVAAGTLRLIVTPVIVAELVYVAESLFDWGRAATSRQISELLGAEGLEVREQRALVQALDLYRDHRRLDFADAYLAACAVVSGPAAIASLDRDFDRLGGVRRIRS